MNNANTNLHLLLQYKKHQQKQLEIQLQELHSKNEILQNKILNNDLEQKNNRQEHANIKKEFYIKIRHEKVSINQFTNREFYLEKCDSNLDKLKEQSKLILGNIHKLEMQIKDMQIMLKILVVKQEKYKYLLESSIH